METGALVDERCMACRVDSPRLTAEEVATLLPGIPGWDVIERNGSPRLQRIFRFPDFRTALTFTERAGDLAETEGHHPSLLTEWGRVRVTWTTHAIRGVHRNDVVMAAKTDRLFEEAVSTSVHDIASHH